MLSLIQHTVCRAAPMHSGVLQWFTRQASEVENGMTCVEVRAEWGYDSYEMKARTGSGLGREWATLYQCLGTELPWIDYC